MFWNSGTTSAQDEGNGHISFIDSYWTDTVTGNSTFYLVNCASGEGVNMVEEDRDVMTREDTQSGVTRTRPLMRELIDSLRANGDLLDYKAVMKAGRKARFESRPTKAGPKSETAICACQTYYRDTIGHWAKE